MKRHVDDESTLAARVGGQLRRMRKDRGLTLAALSQACGVSVSYLSAVEKGINHPSLHTLASITEALGVSIPEVLAHEGQETLRRAKVPDGPRGLTEISHPLLSLRSCVVSALPGDHGACPVDLDDRGLFVYVVSGTVVVRVDSTDYTLDGGDALDVTEPGEVSWRAVEASMVTWVSCPAQRN
ncbi:MULTISPECIES: helix-turn-helix transcriptional regulator [unclassified Streptomyces]|uniref:helix-turn-helix domain-containing protein n=1 Tax=unclassified Streptomyces TaxID=2593676 RepID=UPI0033A4A0BA